MKFRFRESAAWILVSFQFLFILSNNYYLRKQSAFEITKTSSPPSIQQNGSIITKSLVDKTTGEHVTKIFHVGNVKFPYIDPLHGGSCWCTPGEDDFCACTPSLAIDVVLASGPSHVWLVRRKDTGQYAAMGGFVEVGETTEEAVKRELFEETGMTLATPPILFGMYSDPQRDVKRHRHSVSAVYIIQIPLHETPVAGDDVKEVERVALEDLEKLDFFIDHKSIMMDYKRFVKDSDDGSKNSKVEVDYNVPFKRSVCGAMM
mmetsp:Transcript_48890/g.72642  ORF Transcript_48890/g.72642 Transcript_48890/m.72642 type:complete len:261 (-) Transcript_48890:155-937(-)|eukprot:CAMPEP_0195522010 /NCGR_PEP_ID=MMETSP0794_2-20130614/19868_1 /TAXON_ID=515487 /ORGANISM="Stephanopyxis turris, Strain CCMP 815" /LENGTH=260 /DNA_ID=CAMNT_0040651683 /DNA_START=76 /DNA_END=858 /DNA_ORIENTATION=-